MVVIIIAYLICACIAYELLKNENTFERVWFSLIWPITGLLYLVHWLHMKL